MPVISINILSGKSVNMSHLLITGIYLETEFIFIESMIQSRERPFFPLEGVKLFSENYRRWRTHLIAGETAQWLLIILTVTFFHHLCLTLYLTVLPCVFLYPSKQRNLNSLTLLWIFFPGCHLQQPYCTEDSFACITASSAVIGCCMLL